MNDGMNVPGPLLDSYETPSWLFKALDTEFGFTLDGAATRENALLPAFNHGHPRGSIAPWTGHRVFINPPYSALDLWIPAGLSRPEFQVWLLPQRPDNDWYRLLWESKRVELRPLRKRIQFLLDGKLPINAKTGKPQGPRFASLIAIVSQI
jgi:DNA N-6-adenine-methyltransferase Dam